MGQRHQDRFDLGRDLRNTTRPGSLFQGKLQTSEYKAPPGPNDRRPARVQGCHDVFVFLAFACQKQNVGSFDFSCSSLSCSGHLKQPFLFRLAQFNYVFLGHHPLLPGWRSLAYFTCQNLFVEVLEVFEQMTVSVDQQSVRIGERIRSERKGQGLTLKLLSEQVGLSVPYLSQIENGRVNLNITTLESISRALGLPLIDLFVDNQKHDISVVRRSDRRWLDLGGQATESLLVKVRSNLEIFSIRLPPHSGSIQDSSHEGEEFTFVIKGSVHMILANELTYDLTEGDIIYYLSDIPHRWQNETDDAAEILVVNTPATY